MGGGAAYLPLIGAGVAVAALGARSSFAHTVLTPGLACIVFLRCARHGEAHASYQNPQRSFRSCIMGDNLVFFISRRWYVLGSMNSWQPSLP